MLPKLYLYHNNFIQQILKKYTDTRAINLLTVDGSLTYPLIHSATIHGAPAPVKTTSQPRPVKLFRWERLVSSW